MLENTAKHGRYYVNFVMASPIVITSDGKIADVILSKRFKGTRALYNAEAPGLLSKNGADHERLKGETVKAVNDPRSIKAAVSILVKRLRSEAFPEFEEASTKKDAFDLLPVFEEVFTDVVSLWVLGMDGDSADHKKKTESLVEARRTLANLTFLLPTGLNWYFDRIRDVIPLAEYLAILPGAREYLVRRNAKNRSRDIIAEAVIAAKARYDGIKAGTSTLGKNSEEGIIDRLFEIADSGEAENKLTMEEIIETIEAVQVAAQSPLFVALPNLLYQLSQNMATQRAIVAELQRLPRGPTEAVRPDDLRSLPALDLAVRESLRLLPPLPMTANRIAAQNIYKLPGMWALPANYHILVDILSMQRDPEVFGADADKFKPERFKPAGGESLELAGQLDVPFGAAYSPFGRGPHACPGQKVAVTLIKIAAAEVLRKYELAPAPGAAIGLDGFECAQNAPLRMVAGNPVIVKKRK
ncbi:cytochrome P450 [Zopfochytrium polystomum]|nr:cytochrome P450 [Zopfochytrium polystomum]